MAEPTRKLKYLLRRYAAAIRERTLRRGLASLSGAFERWRSGQLDSRELREKIAEFEKASDTPAAPHGAGTTHPLHTPGSRRDAARGKRHGRS
ncbi:MAG: hypothetical protein HY049_00390 [Acidobacteria bacterium]|nr:hypothetical protein [Acidobacteriota bacterium]